MKRKNTALLAKLPTIPQYFQQYVDPKVSLDNTPSIPCPFHGERTGKSFSYSKAMNIWRCFGACHKGGDVIQLHQLNYKIKTYDDAAKELCNLVGVNYVQPISFEADVIEVNENDVYRRRLLASACEVAKTAEDYVELDYIVSKYPYDTHEMELYCSARGRLISKPNKEEL